MLTIHDVRDSDPEFFQTRLGASFRMWRNYVLVVWLAHNGWHATAYPVSASGKVQVFEDRSFKAVGTSENEVVLNVRARISSASLLDKEKTYEP